jgi:diguanylate cyclase (GGDEF)-like protein
MAHGLEVRRKLRSSAGMAGEGPLRDQWLGRRISLARILTALLPMLVFVYSIFASVMSYLGYESIYGRDQLWTQALLVFTGLLMSAGGLVIWAAYRDLESTNAQLSEASFKDEVTHLYNRRFFAIRLEEEIARYRRFSHPVSLVLLDLDGFKNINDQFGHGAGDETLRGVAELLLKHSRGINIICRYGGDEFAILLVETPKDGAQIYADRIRHVLAQHDFPHGSLLSASLGIASLPEDVEATADDLIRAADAALYASKRAGKNRVSTHQPVSAISEASVLLHAISGGSDAPRWPEPRVGVEALVGPPPAGPAERGVLVLNGALDVRLALEGLSDEAYDLILRPAASEVMSGRMTGEDWRASEIRLLPSGLPPLSRGERATITALHDLIAARDAGTGAHSERVRLYALAVAHAHGMTEAETRDIEHGVILHDIGKIGIPDSILLKPGPLTPDEWKVMRTHPEVGRRLVEHIPFLAGAVPIVYHHHERWDGNGYPEGLRGENIPPGARIFAVADALDAMTFDRPYSRAVSLEAARAEIDRCAGTHFDPAVVATFMSIPLTVFEELRRRAS